jgi:SAM-dependent methyltransferase
VDLSGVAFRLTADQVARHDRQRELGAAGDKDLVAVFARAFPAHGVVLDAGGGSGVAVAALRAAGLTPVLMDLSPAMLAASRSRAVPAIRADLRFLPVRTASVDGVHAAYVLPNIAEWRAVAAEFARVLRPGGTAVIAFGATPPDRPIRDLSRRHFTALVATGRPVWACQLRRPGSAASATRGLGYSWSASSRLASMR